MTSGPGRPAVGARASERPSGHARLLDACWAVLTEGANPTVATVCARADCTPPTLYHHFGDLPGLHHAACARAFAEWAAELRRQVDRVEDAGERLRRRGSAYVEWGVAHPVAYRVLFIDPPASPASPAGAAAPGAGFDDLLDDLAVVKGWSREDPSLLVEGIAYWSAVHGLACLAITNPELPTAVRQAALDRLSAALLG